MGRQSAAFIDGEATAWLTRNVRKLNKSGDPVISAIEKAGLRPKVALEIGCANGWRLRVMQKEWKTMVFGIDPGVKDIDPMWMDKGTAEDLHIHMSSRFDMVVYGFCLYLCDREDLFKIVAEGDRVLRDGGHLVIYDFHSPVPFRRPYAHRAGVFSHKMDYAQLWLGNPAYSVLSRTIIGEGDDQTAVTILKKNLSLAWPIHD